MKSITLVIVMVARTLAAAHADECLDKASSQAVMDQCAQAAQITSDNQLNQLFRQIERRLHNDADLKRKLISSQRAWVRFRDAECQFKVAGVEGGSVYAVASSACVTELTQRRVEDLKRLLNCQEGDVSCPIPPAE